MSERIACEILKNINFDMYNTLQISEIYTEKFCYDNCEATMMLTKLEYMENYLNTLYKTAKFGLFIGSDGKIVVQVFKID